MDNIFTYGTDYTYTVDEGPTKCIPTDPQIIDSGTWTFANNQSVLVLNSGTPDEGDLTILQLDANMLKLQEVEYDSSTSSSSTYVFHFVKNQ